MKCIECGKEFEATRATAKYCSASCRVKHGRFSVTPDGLSVTENLSVAPLSVTRVLSVTDCVTATEDDEVGTPIKVLDVEKDLKLSLAKDLGVDSWTEDGIFIRPDITVGQVQTIARLIHAKHGRPCPEFRQQGA